MKKETTELPGGAKLTMHCPGSFAESRFSALLGSFLEMCLADPGNVHVCGIHPDEEPFYVWEPDRQISCWMELQEIIADLERIENAHK